MIHPIGFSFPEEKIIYTYPNKEKILAHIIPGKLDTYIFTNEVDYYNDYKKSLFAITCKKAGWDCMRHYEILANGCIPLFKDIDRCPENIMTFLPKNLLKEAFILYDKIGETKFNDLDQQILIDCEELTNKLLTHTREHLTTKHIANYILNITNNKFVKNILYLSGDTSPDYLRCVTLHGFKTIFGSNCHDYPKVPHIYKSNEINYSRLYGKGITYTNLLEQHLHIHELDNTIIDDIKNKYYDIIIYGSYHRGMPFYEEIKNIYEPNKIILLCGQDTHSCNWNHFVNLGHHVFVREL